MNVCCNFYQINRFISLEKRSLQEKWSVVISCLPCYFLGWCIIGFDNVLTWAHESLGLPQIMELMNAQFRGNHDSFPLRNNFSFPYFLLSRHNREKRQH